VTSQQLQRNRRHDRLTWPDACGCAFISLGAAPMPLEAPVISASPGGVIFVMV